MGRVSDKGVKLGVAMVAWLLFSHVVAGAIDPGKSLRGAMVKMEEEEPGSTDKMAIAICTRILAIAVANKAVTTAKEIAHLCARRPNPKAKEEDEEEESQDMELEELQETIDQVLKCDEATPARHRMHEASSPIKEYGENDSLNIRELDESITEQRNRA